MTREEAIKQLNTWATCGYAVPVVAILMAIEALVDRPTGDIVYCKDCVYCTVQNTKYIYAICQRHGIEFKPFEDDTRTHFCAWGERGEP